MSETAATTNLPLQGKRILVTRTPEQAGVLSERLKALGATSVEFPTIRIAPPEDWQQLDAALHRLFATDAQNAAYYSWLVLTSANGVNICCQRMRTLGLDLETLGANGVRIACIGPATATALARFGLNAALVPDAYIAEGVAAALIEDAQQRAEPLAGRRILLARAAGARQVLATELQQAGALVDEVPAYYTLAVSADDERGRDVLHLLKTGQLDILTFTSSSTVRNFMQWLAHCEEHDATIDSSLLLRNGRLRIACIGPVTSQTARQLGLAVQIEASKFTIDGLVEAIVSAEGKS
ncbi:MAG TPA: uroporphyrinogen-III synthase [Ktedonobacteraceae bacterium]|nr:uroporphyrinogen-III synthase [Ktedonobacteraceae bacterium]